MDPKQPCGSSRNSQQGYKVQPLDPNNQLAQGVRPGFENTLAQRIAISRLSTPAHAQSGIPEERNMQRLGSGLSDILRQPTGDSPGDPNTPSCTSCHTAMSHPQHREDATQRILGMGSRVSRKYGARQGRQFDPTSRKHQANGETGTPSHTAQPTAMPTSQHGGDDTAKQAAQFLEGLGDELAIKRDNSDPSSSTMSASPEVGDGDDGLHPHPELWGHLAKQNEPTSTLYNANILTTKQYGRGNGNAISTLARRPQRFTNRAPSQFNVNRASTVNVNVGMGGFSYHLPSSDHNLREAYLFSSVGNFQSAFPQNREQPQLTPNLTQPQRREREKLPFLAAYNMANPYYPNMGDQVATTRDNIGDSMANAQVPNIIASGNQGFKFPPAVCPLNGTSYLPMDYNGAAHSNSGAAQHQGHRHTSYGSNGSMVTTGYNTIARSSLANMKRTRGQNTGTANGVQSVRKISNETQDSQPLPVNMSGGVKNELSSETIDMIRALRELNEDDIYYAFYGLGGEDADATREVLLAIENNLIRLGLFSVGSPGLFAWFPILTRNPEFLGNPHLLRLGDWYQGFPVYNIATPVQQSSKAVTVPRYATYEDFLDAMNIPSEDHANYGAGVKTGLAVRKSKDDFQPSYSKTGWRPQCNPVLLFQAWLAGIDLTNCMYKGSISQKMIRNALTPKDQNCAVFIKAVHLDVSDKEIFNTFESPIYSYYKKRPIEGKHPDCAATVVFMDRAAAQYYVTKYEHGVLLGGRRCKVVWSRDPACAAEPFERSQSRAIKVSGPINGKDFNMWYIIEFLHQKLEFELVFKDQFDNMEHGMREIELHFQSIRGQSRAAKICLEREFRKNGQHNNTVEYNRDPCGIAPYALGPPANAVGQATLPTQILAPSNWPDNRGNWLDYPANWPSPGYHGQGFY